MSDISVIGLGAMGTALARAQLTVGHDVTVWNRSPEKITPLETLGAKGATNLAEALQASPRSLICVSDYDVSQALFDESGAAAQLKDRTLIQLSSGSPREAGECDTWVRAQGGRYLDGAIMVYPGDIGGAHSQILVAGPQEAFDDCQAFLKCLGGDLRYLGANIRAAATLDMALLYRIVGNTFCTILGAQVCESEGVSVADFAALLPAGERAHAIAQLIHADTFDIGGIGASVDVAAAIFEGLQSQAQTAGINSGFPDLAFGLAKRAQAAGYGNQDSAAMIKILRSDRKS